MLDAGQFRDIVSGKKRGILATVTRGMLGIAELPYSAAMKIRNRRYDRDPSQVTYVEVPVISIGNLSLGGTGKTPFVCWLAKWFRDQSVRVSIVSRGYGAKDGGQNDEAMELEARLPDVPHLQNPDRIAAARVAIEELATQLILLDDGFQHRRIGRDLDIMLIDATEPFGYGHVFPRGTLREPLAGAARANILGLTRCGLVDNEERLRIKTRYQKIAPDALWLELDHQPSHLLTANGERHELTELNKKDVAAFCGIGNPSAFHQSLTSTGCHLRAFRDFPDHHNYGRSDVDSIANWANENQANQLVCTHKDLVKINVDQVGGVPLAAMIIELQLLSGEADLENKLRELLRKV